VARTHVAARAREHRLDVLPGVTEDQLWLRRVGANLELSVIGTTDSLTINGWYASPGKQIESFHLSDGQALQAGRVQQLVDAMAAFAPPSAGQTSLPQPYQTALQPVISQRGQSRTSPLSSSNSSLPRRTAL
jgi:hypothetical protein